MLSKIIIDESEYDIKQVFVMPNLSYNKEEKYINTFEDLIALVSDKKLIYIEGQQKSGKTTIIKRLFTHYHLMGKLVVFIDNDDIKPNFLNAIKSALSENYVDKNIIDLESNGKDNNILFVDDIDFKSQEKFDDFIKVCQKYFNTIIITQNSSFLNRKKVLMSSKILDFERIKIERFSLKQRRMLVSNIASLYNCENVELIIKSLEMIISKDNFFDMTSPYYLSIIIEKILKEKLYEERNTANSFSVVFENNINNKIKNVCGTSQIENYLILFRELSYIAYKKDRNNCYIITNEDICKAHEICKNDWGFKDTIHETKEKILLTNIIKEHNEDYRFSENSFYSYFVAQFLSNSKKQGESIIAEIKNLANNITFGNY